MKHGRDSQRRRKIMFILFVSFLLVWSISILMMPIASAKKEVTKLPMFISGGAFWTGLVGTAIILFVINSSRKKSQIFRDKDLGMKQFGLVNFFKNTEAKRMDSIMIASILCFIIARIFFDNLYLLFVFLAIFVFSFGMHCMLNGKNYIYLNYKIRREEKS